MKRDFWFYLKNINNIIGCFNNTKLSIVFIKAAIIFMFSVLRLVPIYLKSESDVFLIIGIFNFLIILLWLLLLKITYYALLSMIDSFYLCYKIIK